MTAYSDEQLARLGVGIYKSDVEPITKEAGETAAFLRALADLIGTYGIHADVPEPPIIPRSVSTLGPLDVPTLHPAMKSDASQIVKIDEEESLVFGWASVAVPDSDGEIIEEIDLEKAAYDFVLEFRDAGQLHKGDAVGRLVESLVYTTEKAQAMGLPEPTKAAWWVGFKIDDADVFAKVKSREFPMFSVQGTAEKVGVV